jgi:hypothetical protein
VLATVGHTYTAHAHASACSKVQLTAQLEGSDDCVASADVVAAGAATAAAASGLAEGVGSRPADARLPPLLAVLVLGEMCVLSCLFLFSQWGVIKADGSRRAVERGPHTSC